VDVRLARHPAKAGIQGGKDASRVTLFMSGAGSGPPPSRRWTVSPGKNAVSCSRNAASSFFEGSADRDGNGPTRTRPDDRDRQLARQKARGKYLDRGPTVRWRERSQRPRGGFGPGKVPGAHACRSGCASRPRPGLGNVASACGGRGESSRSPTALISPTGTGRWASRRARGQGRSASDQELA